jgi:hypothetical protein
MPLNAVTRTIRKALQVQRFLQQIFIENVAWLEKKGIQDLLTLKIVYALQTNITEVELLALVHIDSEGY